MQRAVWSYADYQGERLALLERMRTIAQTQLELIRQDQPNDLLEALAQREQIIADVDRLDARAKAEGLAPDQTAQQGSLRTIVQEILEMDRACTELAQVKLPMYKSDIKAVAASARQLGAYAGAYASGQGIFIDMRQ